MPTYHFSCEAGPFAGDLQPVSFPVDTGLAEALRFAYGSPECLQSIIRRIRDALDVPVADLVVLQPTLAVITRASTSE